MVKELKDKSISFVKVVWDVESSEATWELKNKIIDQYSFFFPSKSIFTDENFCCWGEL
uniref:Uncharacterized protein n=1 Tax=Cajanus cajan TaxID=3821 RepID=A0A151S3Q8_CAJCA|nr:hypothetical protein KK1_028796 [Cajanus cajan]